MTDAMYQYYLDVLRDSGWDMSLLEELGFQQIDPDANGIVDLDWMDLSVDIEVTTMNSELGFAMEDIIPVEFGMEDILPVEETWGAFAPDIYQLPELQYYGIEASDVGSLLAQFEENESHNFEGSMSDEVSTENSEQVSTENSEQVSTEYSEQVSTEKLEQVSLEKLTQVSVEKLEQSVEKSEYISIEMSNQMSIEKMGQAPEGKLEQLPVEKSERASIGKIEQVSTEKEANNNSHVTDKNVSGNVDTTFLTKEFLERIKRLRAEKKKKTTVMLPMGVPAKRGRGRAMTRGHPVALPASCTPLRLQRVMMQNQDLRDNIPLIEDSVNVVSNYADDKEKGALSDKDINHQQIFSDHDYMKKEGDSSNSYSKGHDLELEDGEVVEDEENVGIHSKPNRIKHDKKQRRRGGGSPEIPNDQYQYFDKLPSYFTALSIPHKQFKKTAAHVTRRGGLNVTDYMERDHSPVRDVTATTCNKIPNYYCSFTNSTKYDTLNIEPCKTNEDSNSTKDSSGYSSLCHSVQDSDSSPTRSRSRSVSHSKSRRSSSRHLQDRSRNYRRRSSCSLSSVGSSSRSCSRSSCSGCGSRSRSRSLSISSSRSSSCSSCVSRSSSAGSSRSRSRGRSWKRERQLRAERTNRDRSGGKSRRNGSRSSANSLSRSRSRDYRSRSRSCTPPKERERRQSRERRREAKKKEREDEKDRQMRERRIVYVGGIPKDYTRHKLRGAFSRFGEIEHVQLHFREHGDNYGFVTFMYTCDAYAAIEKGKLLSELKQFDLCFGGRRQFCDEQYADLDGNKEVEEEFESKPRKQEVLDFDELLRLAKSKIKK